MANDGDSLTVLQRNIDRLRRERGWSMRDLSLRAGLNETAVKAIMAGKSESPREQTVRALATALGCDIGALATEAAAGAVYTPTIGLARPTASRSGLAPPNLELPAFADLPRNLPVHGSAEGGPDGIFELHDGSGLAVDLVRRPPGLAGMHNAFALYTAGDSMAPWREPGDLIFVQPGRQPAPGSYVVVVFKPEREGDPRRAMVKRLVRRGGGKVVVQQFNPRKEIELDAASIEQLWRVIDWQEAMGFG